MPLSKKLTQGFDKKKIEDGNGDKGAKGGVCFCSQFCRDGRRCKKRVGGPFKTVPGRLGGDNNFSVADMMAVKYSCWRVRAYTPFLLLPYN